MTEPRTHTPIRLGVLGGSFNPVHLGHLAIARQARQTWHLDRVLFMPCHHQPHKSPDELAPPHHRRAMLALALAPEEGFEICDIELARGGTSYAIDSVITLQQHEPDAEICFIIGADTLLELHKWHRIGELLERCTILTLARPGADPRALSPEALKLPLPQARKLLAQVEPATQIDISASQVRSSVARNETISYLVPGSVEAYIIAHRLYTQPARENPQPKAHMKRREPSTPCN